MVDRSERVRLAAVAGVTALIALGACAWLLRDGLSPTLDASSYLSATHEFAHGHPFTTRLAPSFSNFDVIEFLDRGGRLPFVDFPVLYPTVSGILAVGTGAKAALTIVSVVSVVVVAVLTVTAAGGARRNLATLVLRAAVGVGVVSLSTYRIVTRSVLSEPFFCAVAVALLAALLAYRRDGRRWWLCVALAASAGVVRFVGAPLAVLVVLERRRRDGGWRQPLLWGAVCIAPAAVNIVWANVAGGGHSAGWRGVESADARWFVRSVGGWVDARQGNIGLTYFGGEGPAWWSWPLTIVWLAAGVLGLLGLARIVRSRLPEPLELALAASLVITLGVLVGMAGFDSLVAPENRVMLPAGVLVVVGAAWSARLSSDRRTWAFGALAAAWWLLAVVPRGPNLFDGPVEQPASARAAEGSGAAVVVGADADPVMWWAGLPAAYLPQREVTLTDEQVDIDPLWAALPCALVDADAVVVVIEGPTFFEDPRERLDAFVADGSMTVEPGEGATLYRPAPDACSNQ